MDCAKLRKLPRIRNSHRHSFVVGSNSPGPFRIGSCACQGHRACQHLAARGACSMQECPPIEAGLTAMWSSLSMLPWSSRARRMPCTAMRLQAVARKLAAAWAPASRHAACCASRLVRAPGHILHAPVMPFLQQEQCKRPIISPPHAWAHDPHMPARMTRAPHLSVWMP